MADEFVEAGGEEELIEEEEGGGLFDTIKKYLPLIGGILLVQIIIGYALLKWVFSSPSTPPATEEMAAVGEHASEDGEEQKKKEEKKKKKKKEGEGGLEPVDEVAFIFDRLESVTINPEGSKGRHYAQIHVHLGVGHVEIEEIAPEDVMRLLESRRAKILDTIIRVATTKSLDELNSHKGRDSLKEEIRTRVNEFLSDEHEIIKEVYFASFTTQ